MSSDGPKLSPTNVEDSTLASGRESSGAGAGAAVGVVILVLVLLAVFTIIMTVSNKGLCRWTNGDGIGMYLLKSTANYLTGGILGLVMFFMYDECDSPVRQGVSRRQAMM